MSRVLSKIIDKYHYAMESIKNRYPCKVVQVINTDNFSKNTRIKYQAASKINIRESSIQSILDDPLLLEKFHPTDGVKFGFISCGEILLRENISIEQARELYKEITKNMFADILEN